MLHDTPYCCKRHRQKGMEKQQSRFDGQAALETADVDLLKDPLETDLESAEPQRWMLQQRIHNRYRSRLRVPTGLTASYTTWI